MGERKRGFEIAKGWEDKDIHLPVRKTKHAAAYDIEAAEDAYCQDDEWYMLANRSSGPKKGFVMANSIGIIDADYYENESNDGHFYFQYFNFKDEAIQVKKGDVIGQVIFQKFLTVDDDVAEGVRTGGFGSTDKK